MERLGDLLKQGHIRPGNTIAVPAFVRIDRRSTPTKIDRLELRGDKLIVNKAEVWDLGAFVTVGIKTQGEESGTDLQLSD